MAFSTSDRATQKWIAPRSRSTVLTIPPKKLPKYLYSSKVWYKTSFKAIDLIPCLTDSSPKSTAFRRIAVLCCIRAAFLPPDEGGPPGESAAHGLDHDEIALFDAPVVAGDTQRKRNGSGGRIAVEIDSLDYLLGCNLELLC
jgi:hypothetical protein